jgi:Fic-DOC domain mobile mystery protein B
MTRDTTTGDGSAPLSPEELRELIPNLATKEELNEWERENILRASEWAARDRTRPLHMISDAYIRKLHEKMFGETWRWAGRYRLTERNIGVPVPQIRERLMTLFGDIRYWLENNTCPADEIAIRFHHQLVFIHPFPNGNGRHARFVADLLAVKLGRPRFTWGSANLVTEGDSRRQYLEAVRLGDHGDIQPLLEFARS